MYHRLNLAQLIYFLGALFVALPTTIYSVWNLHFLQDAEVALWLVASIIWMVGGWIVLARWLSAFKVGLQTKIQSVAPPGFEAKAELKSPHYAQYFGADPVKGVVVIVDMKNNVARCEPIGFVQQWASEDNGRQAFMILRFNDFALPTLSIRVARGALEDLKAKVHYALNYSVA
ncbi:hypothetical protein NAV31_18055 [Pseudomonas stutzeri]|nr:hypothetical protein [Stutzerimonas degradans]